MDITANCTIYVRVTGHDGEVYIMAKELAEKVCKAAGLDYAACEVLCTLKGSEFELMTAKHPLFDRIPPHWSFSCSRWS